MFKKRQNIQRWLHEMHIEHYTINDDLSVDVHSNVLLSGKKLKSIPVQFGKINGSFLIADNKLTSLKGCPKVVKNSFTCSNNQLTSLKHCPQEVGEYFIFHSNPIETLKFLPNLVGVFAANEDSCPSLDNFQVKIKSYFSHECSDKKYCIKEFEQLYQYVNHIYYLDLPAEQINALQLKDELSLEISNDNGNKNKKRIKI